MNTRLLYLALSATFGFTSPKRYSAYVGITCLLKSYFSFMPLIYLLYSLCYFNEEFRADAQSWTPLRTL